MIPLYIFDLDGTLALIDHRRHYVERQSCPLCSGIGKVRREPLEVVMVNKTVLPVMDTCQACNGTGKTTADWPAFYAACVADEPNWPVIATMNTLLRAGADVRIWSGRSSEVMNQTLTWLHRFFEVDADEVQLCMRVEGDFTADDVLKAGWLDDLNEYDRKRLVAVFDDRQKVVDMWRAKGVACFQVAPGEF